MRKLTALISLIALSGCAGPMLKKAPCDAVANREDVFVCGKSEVVKKCRGTIDRPELVCEPL